MMMAKVSGGGEEVDWETGGGRTYIVDQETTQARFFVVPILYLVLFDQ